MGKKLNLDIKKSLKEAILLRKKQAVLDKESSCENINICLDSKQDKTKKHIIKDAEDLIINTTHIKKPKSCNPKTYKKITNHKNEQKFIEYWDYLNTILN